MIQKDKKQHFAVCLALALCVGVALAVMGATPLATFTGATLCAIAAGMAKEYGDAKAKDNRWDNMDLLADTIGGVTGATIATIIQIFFL